MNKIFIFLSMMCLASVINAQTMHTVIFVNTQENTTWGGNRTVDRTADYNNMKQFFSSIATAIGYTNDMRAHGLQQDFNKTMIDREIDNLRVGPEDIVVFYYSGHGGNLEQDKWPHLQLQSGLYWQSDIVKKLNSQCANAKLIICIADCCNNTAENGIPGSYNPRESSYLKQLFTNFSEKTTIVMSASIQGQVSYSHRQYGAYFGNCLRIAIAEKTANSNSQAPTWQDIFLCTKLLTLRVTKQAQEPQFLMYNRRGLSPRGSFD